MIIPTTLTTLTRLATVTAASFPLGNSSVVPNLLARSALASAGSTGGSGSSPCSNGVLSCSDDGTKFALCNWGNLAWEPVAAGTKCSCSGGQCGIVAAYEIVSGAPNPGRPSSGAPSTIVSVTMTPPSSSSAPTSASAYPSSSASPSHGSGSSSGAYGKTYSGNGLPSDGWPTESDFLSFDTLWEMNMPILKTGCSALSQKDNSLAEIEELRAAILSVSKEAGVNPVFGLAIAGQESNFCARVASTTNGVVNNGIYQSHDGSGTCYNEAACPKSEIVQMCKDGIDGVTGSSGGPGLKQLIKQAGSSGAQGLFKAARMYNSGSVAADGNLSDGNGATACYVSDVANRMLGWSKGTSGCTLTD